MDRKANLRWTAFAVLAVAGMIGVKVGADLAAPADPWGGVYIQRDLGRTWMAPVPLPAPEPLRAAGAPLLYDPAALDPRLLEIIGATPQGEAAVVADAELERDVLEVPYEVTADGYAALMVPIHAEPSWILHSHLEIVIRGSGVPGTLQIAVWDDGPGGGYAVAHHLALQTERWTVISVPLLALLDGERQPWPVDPVAGRLVLTVLPFSNFQEGTVRGAFRLAEVFLVGDARERVPPELRADLDPRRLLPRSVDPERGPVGLATVPPGARPWFRCGDLAPDRLELHPARADLVVRRTEGCGLALAVGADEWVIARLALPARPPGGEATWLVVEGDWPPGLAVRFSLRSPDGVERPGEALWWKTPVLEHAPDAAVAVPLGPLPVGPDPGEGEPGWTLDLDFHADPVAAAGGRFDSTVRIGAVHAWDGSLAAAPGRSRTPSPPSGR